MKKENTWVEPDPDMTCHRFIEWFPCLTYVVLYVVLDVLIANEGQTNAKSGKREYLYTPGTLVLLSEAGKLAITSMLLAFNVGIDSPSVQNRSEYASLDGDVRASRILRFWPLGAQYAVPAFLYTLWNLINYQSLLLVSLSVYSVMYQTVLFFSAGFWCLVFKKSLTLLQWFALFLLAGGVFSVHMKPNFEFDIHLSALWVLLQAFISALASVANEYLYKDDRQRHADINQQNFWLYSFTTSFTALYLIMTEGPSIYAPQNFFRGYTVPVVAIILVSIVLGLAVSLILKHCNVIIKLYAQAIHSPLEVVTAHVVLGTELTIMILVASLLIGASTVLYYLGKHVAAAQAASLQAAKTVEASSKASMYVETPEMDPAPYPEELQQNLIRTKSKLSSS